MAVNFIGGRNWRKPDMLQTTDKLNHIHVNL